MKPLHVSFSLLGTTYMMATILLKIYKAFFEINLLKIVLDTILPFLIMNLYLNDKQYFKEIVMNDSQKLCEKVIPFKKVKKSLKPSDLSSISYTGVIEAKYDGSRYRIRKVGKEFNIFSKRVSVVTRDFVDKTENFPQFHYIKDFDIDLDIEVELVVNDGRFCKSSYVTKVAGSNPDRAIAIQQEFGWLNAILIDVHFFGEEPIKNIHFMINILNKAMWAKYSDLAMFLLPTVWNYFPGRKLEDIYKEAIDFGYEGIMLKDMQYRNAWAKVKKVDSWDYVIHSFKDSDSEDFKNQGWIGSIVFGYVEKVPKTNSQVSTCFPINERVFQCRNQLFLDGGYRIVPCGTCSGFDYVLRDKLSKNQQDYVGRVIEIEGQELDKKFGVRHPRFIRFRDDKDALECTKESLMRRLSND